MKPKLGAYEKAEHRINATVFLWLAEAALGKKIEGFEVRETIKKILERLRDDLS